MERPELRANLAPYVIAGSLLVGLFFATDAQPQTSDQGGSTTPQPGGAAAKGDDHGAKAAAGAAQGQAKAPKGQAKAPKGPSEDYQESIRRTVERRRERRARRGQGISGSVPAGAIVPWPMPAALIIRQTPQTHDEVESFLGLLRK
jgi:hypothetical protein